MTLADPSLAPWLLLVPIAATFAVWRRRKRQEFRDGLQLAPATLRLSRLSGRGRDALVIVSATGAVLLLTLAALRPRAEWATREPEFERQDLVLILDRSASMRARDVAPSRFDRALDEIRTFLRDKPPSIDRVALIGFSGTALTISHLTRDPGSLLFFLDWIREDESVHFGTDMAAAIGSALEVVERDPTAQKPVFVLVSDGDDHGPRLEEKLQQLRAANIRLHCIGIGTRDEVAIPAALGATQSAALEDEQGRPLTTRFDPAALRRMASDTGGRYFASTTGRELLPALRQIVEGERKQVGWKRVTGERDAHRPLLLIAAAAVVILMVTT